MKFKNKSKIKMNQKIYKEQLIKHMKLRIMKKNLIQIEIKKFRIQR